MGAKMRLYGGYTQNLARFGEVIGKTPKSAHILTPKNAQIRGLLPYDLYIPYAGVLILLTHSDSASRAISSRPRTEYWHSGQQCDRTFVIDNDAIFILSSGARHKDNCNKSANRTHKTRLLLHTPPQVTELAEHSNATLPPLHS